MFDDSTKFEKVEWYSWWIYEFGSVTLKQGAVKKIRWLNVGVGRFGR